MSLDDRRYEAYQTPPRMTTSPGQSTFSIQQRDLPILSKHGHPLPQELGIKSENLQEPQLSWESSEIWTSPPTRLLDGSDHPFFKNLQNASNTSYSSLQSSAMHDYETPLIYPFIPAPTLYCEPESIDVLPTEGETMKRNSSPEASPQTNKGSRNSTPSNSGPESETAKSTPGNRDTSTPAVCRSTYVRRAESDGGKQQVIHGQIWRGKSEDGRPWRRNQWVKET
jgi:hypothetical protein